MRGGPQDVAVTAYGRGMPEDPRLVARSETGSGTRQVRPETSRTTVQRPLAQGPGIDPDDLLATRAEERESRKQWRVRLWEHQVDDELWWAKEGGYTTFDSNGQRFESRWDAWNAVHHQLFHPMRWRLEEVQLLRTDPRRMNGPRYDELVQAFTAADPEHPSRPVDGRVHAMVDGEVPGRALCGAFIAVNRAEAWPPPGSIRCEL